MAPGSPDHYAKYCRSAPTTYTYVDSRLLHTYGNAADDLTYTAADIPFAMRIVVQALLPGTPPDIAAEAHELFAKIGTAVPADYNVTSSTPGLEESCPACNARILLQDITAATCANGHVWGKSSPSGFQGVR